MKERPILMSAPMVRATLADTKTQTRRALRVQPPQHTVAVGRWQDPPGFDAAYWAFVREGAVEHDHPFGGAEIHGNPWRCPYGQPGDRLWVREAHVIVGPGDVGYGMVATEPIVRYRATEPELTVIGGWRPSIHMPRWASRILLEVTGVRVERLHDMREPDALAEGYPRDWHPGGPGPWSSPMQWYADLWKDLNGADAWAANPWVWVVEFRRLTP